MTYHPDTTMYAEHHAKKLYERASEIKALRAAKSPTTVWDKMLAMPEDEYHTESARVIQNLVDRIRAEGGEG